MHSNDEDNPLTAAMLGGSQTSTTKALLLFIHVPKVLRVHIAKGDEAKNNKTLDRKESTDDPLDKSGSSKSDARKSTMHKRSLTPATATSAKPTHKKTLTPASKPAAASGKGHHRKTSSIGNRPRIDSFASSRNEAPMVPLDTTSSRTISPRNSNNNNNHSGAVTSPTNLPLSGSIKSTDNGSPEEKDDDEDDDALVGGGGGEHEIGYVEADEEDKKKKKQTLIEHVITAEEMAAVVNLELHDGIPTAGQGVWDAPQADDEDPIQSPNKTEIKDEIKPVPPEVVETKTLSSAVKNFFGIVTNNDDEITNRLDREEAIRIVKAQTSMTAIPSPKEEETKKGPAPNTEIKIEALLQLTCKNLFKEGCFFTAPATIDIKKGEGEWIQFTIMCKQNSIDLVLERLERIGVGSNVGMISIYKSELLKTADWPAMPTEDQKKEERQTLKRQGSKRGGAEPALVEEAKQEWKNAASRMRVEQIKEQIHEQAVGFERVMLGSEMHKTPNQFVCPTILLSQAMSFDFLALLLIASTLAGIGLIANSTVVLVASMLVSPIMGPVMGITFGSRVFDWKLAKSSAAVEVGALLIAVAVGAVVGFASAFSAFADDWPTEEMSSRGDVGGLITGMAIAIPRYGEKKNVFFCRHIFCRRR